MNRAERDALLLGDRNSSSGGGQPLPEALRAVLTHLHDNSVAGTRTLHRIIREQPNVAHKDRRILEVWGTWNDFCNAIIGVLHDGEYITGSFEDGWIITDKSVPGKSLMILRGAHGDEDRRIRVTFYSERDREMRNGIQKIRDDVDNLLTQIAKVRDSHPVFGKVEQYQLASSQLLREALSGKPRDEQEEDEEEKQAVPPRKPRQRLRAEFRRGGVVRDWVFAYMRAHPRQLMSVQSIAAAFDEHDKENIESGRFGEINTAAITARLRDLNEADPGEIVWVRPPEVRRVSAMYVPPGEE